MVPNDKRFQLKCPVFPITGLQINRSRDLNIVDDWVLVVTVRSLR